MWSYRKMLKIKWIERITNEAVLDRMKEKRELWCIIQIKRNKMIGHLLRHDSLTKSVIEDDVTGHIRRGRPRMVHKANCDIHGKE